MNKTKCEDCVHFDTQYKNIHRLDPKTKKPYADRVPIKGHGYCAAQSIYPAKEQDGQVFPPDARRAEPGELAKMVPVSPTGVVATCTSIIRKQS